MTPEEEAILADARFDGDGWFTALEAARARIAELEAAQCVCGAGPDCPAYQQKESS